MGRYYNVRRRDNPDAYGWVVKLSGGKLETFTGNSEPSDFGCSVDAKGNLVVDENFFYMDIVKEQAEYIREIYENWDLLRAWILPDTSPQSALANIPGSREYSQERS